MYFFFVYFEGMICMDLVGSMVINIFMGMMRMILCDRKKVDEFGVVSIDNMFGYGGVKRGNRVRVVVGGVMLVLFKFKIFL